MHSLVERVASRYSSSRQAAFIPDKFFKGFETELRKLYRESLGDEALQDVPFLITDRVIPLHQRFIKELIALAPRAKQTLEDRLSLRVAILEKLRESYTLSRSALATPYPVVSLKDHILEHIKYEVGTSLRKLLPTLGKAMKVAISIEPTQVDNLVNRALKKVTPEISTAILDDNWANDKLKIKYDFYKEQVDKSVPRLTKKSKVATDFLTWFMFTRDVLDANYSEQTQRYTEFDLNGMSVMILDEAVTAREQDKYIKYLDAAYHILQKKKLGRAWYGRVIIECETCGGPNPHTGGGTGGHFNIQKDWVKIFSRPSPFIIELMCHELGHRYWFKSMSQAQRHKFETFVRAYKSPRPQGIVPVAVPSPRDVDKAKKHITEAKETMLSVLLDLSESQDIRTELRKFSEPLSKAAWEVSSIRMYAQVASAPKDSEAMKLFDELQKELRAADEYLYSSRKLADETDIQKARDAWVDKARDHVDAVVEAAFRYMDRVVKALSDQRSEVEKARQEEWNADPRQILPVTNYGKSNIDEAFAEAFSWYVLDRTMTEDQKGIFRSVLLRQDRVAARVARRYVDVSSAGRSRSLIASMTSKS